jgi:hypothetical protein
MNKTTVVFHSADFDGLFCREIARHFLPDAELIGWDYKDPKIPFPSEGTVYVLDLSPECFIGSEGNSIPEFAEVGYPKRLIWIDHHKTAIEKWSSEIPGYRIDGVAACRLAWFYFTAHERFKKESVSYDHQWFQDNYPWAKKEDFVDRKLDEPLAVRLAGEYDIWDKRDERAEIFQLGLRSRELSASDWADMLSQRKATIEEIEGLISVGHTNLLNPDGTHTPPVVWQMLEAGKLLQSYQQRNDAEIMHRSFMVELEGLKFLTLNTARFNSLTFASKDVPETGHDALMGFNTDGKRWTVSLYHAKHRTDLDLSSIAKKFGGGGHRGACGFIADKLPFMP